MGDHPDELDFGSLALPLVSRAVFEAVPDLISALDLELRFLFVNRVVPGLTIEELRGRSLLDFIAPDARDEARRCFARVIATGRPDRFEARGHGPHGEVAFYESRVAPILEGDKPVALAVVASDVTERKRYEMALREREEQLRILVAATEMGLWSWDPLRDAITWDDRMCEIFGRTRAEVPQTLEQYRALVHPEDQEKLLVRRSGDLGTAETRVSEYRVVRPDGALRWLQMRGRQHYDADGRVVRVFGGTLDITERREAELHAIENQKLEAIGRLTAGIGHNLNNLLTVVVPNLELIAHAAAPHDAALAEPLEHATHAARRASELMRQMLVFAGKSSGAAATPCDPLALVRRTLALCRGSFDRRIALVLEGEPHVPRVAIDVALIEQALLNLCINARDAVLAASAEPRITIVVTAVPRSAAPSAASLHPSAATFIRIAVCDNGPGIDARTRARLFEPFFTTKPVGHGTGLGLSTSYAIVSEQRGALVCDSEPGRGATLSMFLPVAGDGDGASPEARPSEGVAPIGHEKILVIDDELAVRIVTGRVLKSGGYRAVLAGDGDEALAALGRESFDLVLLDVTMPGRSGPELASHIRALSPAPIIYFSGHLGDDLPEAVAVIEKPASRATLLARVRAVLDARRAAP